MLGSLKFVTGINSGDIQPDLMSTHGLGRNYPAMKFRLEVANHLLPSNTTKGSKIQVRSNFIKKASKIYFSKDRRGHMEAASLGVRDSKGSRSHYPTTITKRHECMILLQIGF